MVSMVGIYQDRCSGCTLAYIHHKCMRNVASFHIKRTNDEIVFISTERMLEESDESLNSRLFITTMNRFDNFYQT